MKRYRIIGEEGLETVLSIDFIADAKSAASVAEMAITKVFTDLEPEYDSDEYEDWKVSCRKAHEEIRRLIRKSEDFTSEFGFLGVFDSGSFRIPVDGYITVIVSDDWN